MQAEMYAQAFTDVVAGKTEQEIHSAVERLVGLLKRRGHLKLLPAISRAISRDFEKKERRQTLTLRTPKKLSSEEHKKLVSHFDAMLPKTPFHTEKIDETLASGFVLETTTARIDGSAKRSLLTLYRNILSQPAS